MHNGSNALAAGERSAGIDLVRVVGVVAVVAGHVWDTRIVASWLYPWHVPVFFFLTGYLWKAGRSLQDEWAGRRDTLATPYLVWLACLWPVFALVQWINGDLSFSSLARPIYGGLLAVQPFTTFWFISVLLFTALLYRAMERLPFAVRLCALGVAVLLASIPAVSRGLATTPLAAGSALTCIVFVAAGAGFRAQRTKLYGSATVTGSVATGFALVAIGFLLVHLAGVAVLNLKGGNFGTPVLSIVAGAAISAGLVLLAEHLVRTVAWAGRIASHAAPWALVVVIAHPVVLWLLKGQPSSWLKFWLALAVPAILAYFLQRTSAGQWTTGRKSSQ